MLCFTKKHKSSSDIIAHVTPHVTSHVTAHVTAKKIEIFVVSYQRGQFQTHYCKEYLKKIYYLIC